MKTWGKWGQADPSLEGNFKIWWVKKKNLKEKNDMQEIFYAKGNKCNSEYKVVVY